MIRALIVDDESLARSNLRVLLANEPEVTLIGECASGRDALAAIRSQKPDLVFLDVQMPELDGFDVVEGLGTELPAAIVFVTAYDQHALRAFDAGALDYLLKPFDNARFALTLARVRAKLAATPPSARVGRLAVRTGRQVTFVATHDIDRIESADYCVVLHVGSKTHVLRRSMDAVERELDTYGFCRVHRSSIVNLARVVGLATTADGTNEVVLVDGARLSVSRRYRAPLQTRLAARR